MNRIPANYKKNLIPTLLSKDVSSGEYGDGNKKVNDIIQQIMNYDFHCVLLLDSFSIYQEKIQRFYDKCDGDLAELKYILYEAQAGRITRTQLNQMISL